jgi:hypothetical protein
MISLLVVIYIVPQRMGPEFTDKTSGKLSEAFFA